jgi:hypothetical protein
VRVGNLGDTGVAFFYDRLKMPPPKQLTSFIEIKVKHNLIIEEKRKRKRKKNPCHSIYSSHHKQHKPLLLPF